MLVIENGNRWYVEGEDKDEERNGENHETIEFRRSVGRFGLGLSREQEFSSTEQTEESGDTEQSSE